eukprot:6225859-Alexandrium_andersonii.AAC.1
MRHYLSRSLAAGAGPPAMLAGRSVPGAMSLRALARPGSYRCHCPLPPAYTHAENMKMFATACGM